MLAKADHVRLRIDVDRRTGEVAVRDLKRQLANEQAMPSLRSVACCSTTEQEVQKKWGQDWKNGARNSY